MAEPGLAGMRAHPPGQPGRQLDREHHRVLRHLGPPRPGRALGIAAGLPRRAPEPARQHPGRLRHRHARLHQVSGSVDPRGVLTRTNPVASHAVIVLPDMSSPGRGAPRPHITAPPAARDRSIHDATSAPWRYPARPATQRPAGPRRPARRRPAPQPGSPTAPPRGTNPPGGASSGPDDTPGRAALTGHAPPAGNPASPRSRSCQLCWGRAVAGLVERHAG